MRSHCGTEVSLGFVDGGLTSRCLTLSSPLVPMPLVPGSAQPHNAAAILRALACASQVLVPSCF